MKVVPQTEVLSNPWWSCVARFLVQLPMFWGMFGLLPCGGWFSSRLLLAIHSPLTLVSEARFRLDGQGFDIWLEPSGRDVLGPCIEFLSVRLVPGPCSCHLWAVFRLPAALEAALGGASACFDFLITGVLAFAGVIRLKSLGIPARGLKLGC